jgi:hypothetical protein
MARSRPVSPGLRRRNLAVLAICVGSGIGALLADGAATRLTGVDAALRVAFALALTLAATQARRSAWVVAAGLPVIPASREPLLFFCSLAVFAAAVYVSVRGVRSRVLGAAIGGAIAQLLLRLPAWGPNGTTALVAAIAATVLVASCTRSVGRRTPRRLLKGAGLAAGFFVVLSGAFGVSLLLGRADLQGGIDAARAGVRAARRGNTELAIERFDEASRKLRSAAEQLDSSYSRAARIVPVVGQHEAALRTLVADAAELAATGALAAREANVDALRVQAGRLDPAQVAALQLPLRRVSRALAVSADDLRGVHSPWFVGPVQGQIDDLRHSVRRAERDAATASLAVRAAPRLLGSDRPTRYFVMFVTPSEARASGGLMGNYAILTVADGRFEITDFGRASELNAAGDRETKRLTGLTDYVARYGRFAPAHEWRNVTMSPDFPSVAEAVRQLYPQSGGTAIDGVISLDPQGLAALLQLTGPVRVQGRSEPLTAKDATQFLLRGQYVSFGDRAQRIDFLEEAARTVTDRLTHSTLPGPRVVGRVLGPAARAGHLRVAFFEPDGDAVFRRLGVAGALRETPGDTLGVATQNSSGNKIELFLHRSLDVDTVVHPKSGRTTSSATITLRNDAPTTGLPNDVIGNAVPGLPVGTNRLYLSLYTTLDATSATLDGAPAPIETQIENGLRVHSTSITIPAGGRAVLRVRLVGANRLVREHDRSDYRLHLWHQTTVNPDRVSLRVRVASPWRFGDRRGLEVDGPAVRYRGKPEHDLDLSAAIEG